MEKTLCLTEDEAMGLLDIMLVSETDLTPAQRSALLKLSEHCRQFLREEPDPAAFPRRESRAKQLRRYPSSNVL